MAKASTSYSNQFKARVFNLLVIPEIQSIKVVRQIKVFFYNNPPDSSGLAHNIKDRPFILVGPVVIVRYVKQVTRIC